MKTREILRTGNRLISKIIYLTVFSTLLLSCKKEDDPRNKYVYAGRYDSTYLYYEWHPQYEVPITWDSLDLYGIGKASVDLDQDGSPDMHITLATINDDNIHLLGGGYPDPFPYCYINVSNGFQMAFYTRSFGVGHGNSSSVSYIDCLDAGECINQLHDWRTEGKLWFSHGAGSMGPPPSDWHFATQSHYMALKQEGRRWGWIELSTFDDQSPLFIRLALQ